MKTYTRIIISITLLLDCALSNANDVFIHKINIESGLSSNYIKTIFKDSQGLMWFGTNTGLDSYDGLQTVAYGRRFKTPLKGIIQSILENKDGSFWVATDQGAYLYNRSQNRTDYLDFGTVSIDVKVVYKSSFGIIYFGTDKGLFYLEPKINKAIRIFPKNKNIDLAILGIIEDKYQQLWIANTNKLHCFSPNKKEIGSYEFPEKQTESTHTSIALIDSNIYFGTSHGIDVFNTQTHIFSSLPEFKNKGVISLADDNKNKLFIGTDGEGLSILDLKSDSVETYKTNGLKASSISSNIIASLYFDKSGILWVGTFTEGVNFFSLQKNKTFSAINFPGNLPLNIRSMFFSPQNEKYLGTRNGLVLLDSGNKIKTVYHAYRSKGLRSKTLTTISPYPGKPDLLLIGTFGGGISIFNKKTSTFSNFSTEKTFLEGTIYKFCTDSKNNLWIATLNGLYKYNLSNKSLQRYDLSSIMGNNEIFTLRPDHSNRIWVGTKTGVCYYSMESNKFIQPTSCKPYRYHCPSIFEDKSGNIWICFNKGGVLKIDRHLKQKMWITTDIGLPENTPSSLIEDKEGNVWIATQKGLFKVSPSGYIRSYGMEDGLNGLAFCPESVTLDRNGNLWWSNEKGLVSYSYSKEAVNSQIPNIIFTDLFINGTRFSADTLPIVKKVSRYKYTLDIQGKTKNNLEFRVASLNYINASANQYSFLLTGKDKEWSKPSTNNIAAYNNLKEGSYVLKIKASNIDGIWTPVPYEVRITITPFFYETTTFIFLIILVIGGSILFFTRTYIIRMKDTLVSQMEEVIIKQQNVVTKGVFKVSEEKGELIKEKLFSFMREEKPYLNPGLKQADVAAKIGFSVHEISQVLNSQLNQNFSEFINSYRIEEVKIRVESGNYEKFTLTAIAQQCGFSAKSSFLRAFKKATGVSPSEYFKERKIEDKE